MRAATRAPGKAFGAPRAIATSSTLAVPDDAVAVGTRALVLLHAQQGTGATLVASSVTGAVRRPARAGGRDDGAHHRGGGRAARRRQCARRLRGRADADDDLERGARRRGRLGAGRRRRAAARPSRSCSSCSSRRCPTAAPCCCSSARGRPRATCRGPTPPCARPRAPGERPSALDPGAVVACADLGLAVDAAGIAYAVVERLRRPRAHLDAARRRRLQRRADDGARRRARRASRLARRRGPAAGAAGLDRRLRPARAAHRGVDAGGHRAPPPRRRCRARRRRSRASRSRASTAASAIVTETTGTGAAQRSGTDVLERPAAATPWTVQNVRTGLAEPVGSPQLAMGALGALALWVEGNVIVASGTDHGLPRVDALAKPKKVGIGVLGPYSVRASDTWSPIVDVTWRYGDGTSEHGASVRHAYSRAGAFHVTVRRQRRGRQRRAAHVRGRRRSARAPVSRRRSRRPRPRGLRVPIACLPSNPSVTGTRDRRDPGRQARAVPLHRPRARHARSCRGRATRGQARRRARDGPRPRRPAAPARRRRSRAL